MYNYQGKRCVIKDYCVIKDGSVIAADTVLPPFSVSEGAPGTVVVRAAAFTERVHAQAVPHLQVSLLVRSWSM